MKNYYRLLLTTILCSTSVFADEEGITIKPSGGFDFTSGYIDNNGANPNEKVSANKNNFGFLTTARLLLTIENKLPNNISYGAKIALNTSTRSDRKMPTSLFFESDSGKWELGSEKSAVSKMRITGYSNAAATGGCWDVWVRPDIRYNPSLNRPEISYVTNSSNFLDAKTRNVNDIEFSRKITYYTPEIKGFQLGVSYVPDTSNIGSHTTKDPSYHLGKLYPYYGYNFDIKDGVGVGITKKFQFDEKTSAKISFVGETGKVVYKYKLPQETPKASLILPPPDNLKFKKLRTYSVGAELKHDKWAFSGGYMNYEKSLTANSELFDAPDRKTTYLYSAGAKYSFEKLSVSGHYFKSNNKKNTIGAATFGMDYKLAPGILPYAEVTFYNAKGWYRNAPTDKNFIADKHKGTLFLVGTKLEF
ncbi:MAG: hypothetical protein RLZZ59_29 [Pseudomonadota bacterium]|jgi:predicted porin